MILILFVLSVVALFGYGADCSKSDRDTVTIAGSSAVQAVAPTTIPANGGINAPLNGIITANFSQNMNYDTINFSSYMLRDAAGYVNGTIKNCTMCYKKSFFTPSANLSPNTTYTCTVTSACKDASNVAFAANYSWSFTTGTTILPTVVSVSPTNNSIGIPLDSVITATFSEAMDPATISTTTFTLAAGMISKTGTVTYAAQTATFTPSTPLAANTQYTVTVTTGAKNTLGDPIPANYSWKFTTGN